MVSAAVAALVDQPSSTSLPPSVPNRNASPERPTAAQRGGSFASSGPAAVDAEGGAGGETVVDVGGGGGAAAAGEKHVAVALERPAAASIPRGWPGGPPRAPRVPDGEPVPFHAVPFAAANHKPTCDCKPCWVARAVSSGGLMLPPHGRGSQCGADCLDCEAWRSVRDESYRRFVEQAKRAPTVKWAKARRAANAAEPREGRPAGAPPTASTPATPAPGAAVSPTEPSATAPASTTNAGTAARDLAPLYPDNLSPDDIACARAHVELAIRRGDLAAPEPDPAGEMPARVRMHWKKLKASRRKAQAAAYMEIFVEACELPKLRRLRPHAPPTATYRELVELERADRARARWRRHRDDCAGCPDCRHDCAAQLLDVGPAHEPLCSAGHCADCDWAFELFTMTPPSR